jgi:alpha-L-fucosidase 2
MKEAHVILSIQISDSNGSNTTSANGNGNGLEERCWGRIEKALALGPSQLKKRHTTFFNHHTSHSELFLGPSPPSHASTSSPSSQETVSLSGSKTIASHLTSLYWFNKYLLLSSSSRSVSNLQGLWSDGPWNPWNSDYHLNINLQMVYWPTYSLGLHRAITSPFIDFIRQISHSGHLTAKKLYNCDGWVGHGFTDSFLEMGIRGDLQWALCVTCGSWLALSLWDHMIYSTFSLDFTMNTFLPIYRSIIDFYLCYLFQGPDGYVHTGPTTSPENSFTGYLGGKATGRKIVQYLTLSPAIDMSILRQVISFPPLQSPPLFSSPLYPSGRLITDK